MPDPSGTDRSGAVPDVVEIARALVRCRSITPEDDGAQEYLADLLKRAGFVVHRLRFGVVDNLYARFGTSGPHLCFAGHTDVVPPGPEADWRFPPFEARTSDGMLYGRGSADMKGSVAAMVAAALAWCHRRDAAQPGSLSLLITGDEEGPARDGTIRVLEWMADKSEIPDHCIVGEPTCETRLGDTLKIGRRGSASFHIVAEGVQGHVAYPHKADNPVHHLARLVDRLASLRLDEGMAQFDPSTLAVTSFDVGNMAGNVIPARAEARLNIRFNPLHDFSSLKRFVDDVARDAGGRFRIEAQAGSEAFMTKPGPLVSLVAQAVSDITGVEPKLSTSGGTSDARFIRAFCPVVEFGPLNGTIHQIDECVSVADLQALVKIHAALLRRYFSGSMH